MIMLALKSEQIQAGASWDSVATVSVGVLIIGGIIVLLALLGSRVRHKLRVKRAHHHSRHKRRSEV